MFVDSTASVADNNEGLQELLRVFGYVCKKRKLKVLYEQDYMWSFRKKMY